jgi:hypothetical protein
MWVLVLLPLLGPLIYMSSPRFLSLSEIYSRRFSLSLSLGHYKGGLPFKTKNPNSKNIFHTQQQQEDI